MLEKWENYHDFDWVMFNSYVTNYQRVWHFNRFCNWQHSTCMHWSFFILFLRCSSPQFMGFWREDIWEQPTRIRIRTDDIWEGVEKKELPLTRASQTAPSKYWRKYQSFLIQIDHLLRNRATPSSSALKLYTTELQNRQIEQVCGWSIVPQGLAIFQKMKIGVSQSSTCWFTSRIEQSNLLLDFCLRNNTSERFVIAAHVGSDYFKLTHNTEQHMGMSENRVYSQWNSHLIGIMIINHWV